MGSRRWPWSPLATFAAFLLIAAVALAQCYTLFRFSGQNVDESEVVAFAVGFFGGDLNPHWFGYGSVPLYFMGAIYFVMGAVGHLLGYVGSIDEYAELLITREWVFYGSARYVFACIGVTTVFMYAWTMRRLGTPLVLVMAYFVLAVSHPAAVGYANFVKTDQFVGLFFSIAVFFLATAPRAPRTLLVLSIVSALALTSKVSSAPILVLFAVAAWLNYSTYRDWRPIAAALTAMLVLILVAQPFSNPVLVAIKQLTTHASDRVVSIVRPHYDNPWQRITTIGAFLWSYYSKLHPGLIILTPFALAVRETRTLAMGTAAILLLIISPFLVASSIQPYWMIPGYPLLAIFVILGGYGLHLLVRRRSVLAARIVLGSLALVALALTVRNLKPVASHWMQPAPVSNESLLTSWLEQNVLGRDIVVLERRHSNHMPRVHDLSSVAISREASRLFIFNRRQNGFLASLFDNYLVEDYPRKVAVVPELPPREASSMLLSLELSVLSPLQIESPRICDVAGDCSELELHKVDGGLVRPVRGGHLFEPSQPRQRLVFRHSQRVPLDGSRFLKLALEGDEGEMPATVALGPNGAFRGGERYLVPFSGKFRVPLIQIGEYPWLLNLRDPRDLKGLPPTPGRRLLLVTSPAIYDRYTVLDPGKFKGKDRERVLERQAFYRRLLTAAPRVHREAAGGGPVMEVYDVSGFREEQQPQSQHAAVARNGKHIWTEPAAVDGCTKATTVLVLWDVTELEDVRQVEVKTDRGDRGEGMFARAGPIGSKSTGPWISAGRQLILRNAADGSEISRVTVQSLPCK